MASQASVAMYAPEIIMLPPPEVNFRTASCRAGVNTVNLSGTPPRPMRVVTCLPHMISAAKALREPSQARADVDSKEYPASSMDFPWAATKSKVLPATMLAA